MVLPFWQQLLPKMHYVICLRNPIDVARSLQNRNGLSIEKAAVLWLRHVQSALTGTSGQRRILLFYEDIMEDWRSESRRLVGFLYGKECALRYELPTEIGEFLDPTLRHYSTPPLNTVNDERIPFAAKSLYALLRAHVSRNKSPIGADENDEEALGMAVERFAEDALKSLALDVTPPETAFTSGSDNTMKADEGREPVHSEAERWRKEAERLRLILQNQLLSESTGLGADYISIAPSDRGVNNTDIKLIAFYLPQFHPIPENDQWWTPADLAVVLDITDRSVRYHCRRLLGPRSRYRLNRTEAQRVCNYICKFGLKPKTFSDSFPIL